MLFDEPNVLHFELHCILVDCGKPTDPGIGPRSGRRGCKASPGCPESIRDGDPGAGNLGCSAIVPLTCEGSRRRSAWTIVKGGAGELSRVNPYSRSAGHERLFLARVL